MTKYLKQEVANLLEENKQLQDKNNELTAEIKKNEETIKKLNTSQDTKGIYNQYIMNIIIIIIF